MTVHFNSALDKVSELQVALLSSYSPTHSSERIGDLDKHFMLLQGYFLFELGMDSLVEKLRERLDHVAR